MKIKIILMKLLYLLLSLRKKEIKLSNNVLASTIFLSGDKKQHKATLQILEINYEDGVMFY